MVPACSSDTLTIAYPISPPSLLSHSELSEELWLYVATLTNVLPYLNAMLNTQHMTYPPIHHSKETKGPPVVVSIDVEHHTTTNFNVLGQTQMRNL